MSRKTRLAQEQARALAALPPPRPPVKKPDTNLFPSFVPPMSLKEALLTNSKWVNIADTSRHRLERLRSIKIKHEESMDNWNPWR